MKKHKNKKLVSDCCNAETKLMENINEFGDVVLYYICLKCTEPCRLIEK